MSFMQNVEDGEDITVENSGRLTERDAEIWSDEFLKHAMGRTMPEIWADELASNEGENPNLTKYEF